MTDSNTERSSSEPGQALTASIASDGADLAIDVIDSGFDALVSSGALDGIPIFGLLNGLYKTARHVPEILYQRKIARLLQAVVDASNADEREKFAEEARQNDEAERLGETILLFLDKADELQKPALIGRLIAAHIRGDLVRATSFRICAMINRAYYPDLRLLTKFRYGTGAPKQSVFNTLAAVGFLDNVGFDGGISVTDDDLLVGGDLFQINDFGVALLKYGFELSIDAASEIEAAKQAKRDAERNHMRMSR